jgi:hypothetical protein
MYRKEAEVSKDQDLASRIETVKWEIEQSKNVTFKRNRLDLLGQLLREEKRENRLVRPTIFLSFAGSVGETLIQTVIPALRKLRIPGSEKTFEVENGMKIDGAPVVLDHIREKVEPCFVFLGILTGKYQLEARDVKKAQYAPGAWVLLEAGIAVSLGLNVVYLIQDGVHDSYWHDTHAHVRHAHFGPGNYQAGLSHVRELVLEYYNKLRKGDQEPL